MLDLYNFLEGGGGSGFLLPTFILGAVTIGFGVLTAAWDGYNAFKSHSRVQTSKSELGDELRMLIMKLQPTFSE